MREYRDYWNPNSGTPSFRLGLGFTPAVKILVIAEVAVFLVLAALHRIAMHAGWEVMSEMWQFEVLGLSARMMDSLYAWQLVTYLLLHVDFFHLFWNMLNLYFLGPLCEQRLGSRRFFYLYFGAGMAGGLAFILPHYFLWPNAQVVGASGAVMGVIVAAAALQPNLQLLFFFLFPMRLRTLAILLVAVDVYLVLFQWNNPVASSAHLGGAVFGFLFCRYEQRVSGWFFRVERRLAARDHRRSAQTRQKVEMLLEKIHEKGITSLSRSEKRFLKKASQEYRDKRS